MRRLDTRLDVLGYARTATYSTDWATRERAVGELVRIALKALDFAQSFEQLSIGKGQ
jgi:hypothetical protein